LASNPEDLRALIDAYRKVCGAAITRYEGQVANYAAARDPVQERAPRYFDWHWIGRGEMVAIGLLTQLFLEKRQDELQKVVRFMALVGLPVEL
jgi:hypothetical protein